MQENEQAALSGERNQDVKYQKNILWFRTSLVQALFWSYLSSVYQIAQFKFSPRKYVTCKILQDFPKSEDSFCV